MGVSDAPLLRKKALRELMQPLHLRLALVSDFVRSVCPPALKLELAAPQDGSSPGTRVPAMQSTKRAHRAGSANTTNA